MHRHVILFSEHLVLFDFLLDFLLLLYSIFHPLSNRMVFRFIGDLILTFKIYGLQTKIMLMSSKLHKTLIAVLSAGIFKSTLKMASDYQTFYLN